MKAVMTQAIWSVVALKLPCMWGRATITLVWFMMKTVVASMTEAMAKARRSGETDGGAVSAMDGLSDAMADCPPFRVSAPDRLAA